MEYNPKEIEEKWQKIWKENNTYKVDNESKKPKFYALDMFPYPSGAGLHVGHPLGYIATDIMARYKRMRGFEVLHPIGFDSFGLPAEQYAIETGQHPAITTKKNIETFKNQLGKIGFDYDWDREIQTSSPDYYKWTQLIFQEIFESWYNNKTQKAENIADLIQHFSQFGNKDIDAVCDEDTSIFSASDWNDFSEKQQQEILLQYRLTFIADTFVNWCPALGTVLANDEVKDGLSERGGYPVERKKMRQWMMRITAYADRLLEGLERLDWSDALKEMQKNWIGKSTGCEIDFKVENHNLTLTAFTTRIDTIFGVSYLVLAPEHDIIPTLTTKHQKNEVDKYVNWAKNRSERERQTEVKTVSGVFTGSYAINPFSGEKIPIWIADYVLSGYGTGVVMGVPSSDDRDFRFAKNFDLPIKLVIEGTESMENPTEKKYGKMVNSEFLNGLETKQAIEKAISFVKEKNLGKAKVNFRLRDAVFSRQRYWGEPVPVYYKNGIPYLVPKENLPLTLPEISEYKPTEDGQPPLARANDWFFEDKNTGEKYPYEHSTMPGWAGSSWYFLRYMDTKNETEIVSQKAMQYWQQVDLYVGGTEHAVGHLLYSRFWTKFLFDKGFINFDEPFKKLVNQGMIQGVSEIMYKEISKSNTYFLGRTQLYFSNTSIFTIFLSANMYDDNNVEKEMDIKQIENSKEPKNILNPIHTKEHILKKIDYLKTLHNPAKSITNSRIDISKVKNNILDIKQFLEATLESTDKEVTIDKAIFICKGGYWCSIKNDIGQYITQFIPYNPELHEVPFDYFEKLGEEGKNFYTKPQVEKMSKRWRNVVNPDDVIARYSADTLRLYEMFLGPLEQSKPWSTQGIDGTHRFLRKLWRLFFDEKGDFLVKDETPTPAELKVLHRHLKGVYAEIEEYSFNTIVSKYMVAVNDLTDLKCHKKAILAPLLQSLAPFAPHIAEELWEKLGYTTSIHHSILPDFEEKYLVESNFEYPISVNGKVRTQILFPLDKPTSEIENEVLHNEIIQKWLEGSTPKKIIVVKGRIVNVVI